MMILDSYKQWLWYRSDSVLPTTVQSTVKLPTPENNMFNGISYLSQFFQTAKDKKYQDEEHQTASTPFSSQNSSSLRSSSSNSLVAVAFPSYLNSGSAQRWTSEDQSRRSSLLEGYEQTVEYLMSQEEHPRLALPQDLKNTFRNANAFEREHSHLPVPVVPPPRLKIPSALYGYLGKPTSSSKKGNDLQSATHSIIIIVLIFSAAVAFIAFIYKNFPEMDREEYEKVKLPRNMEDAKELGRVLSKYKNTNYFEVMTAFFITYIFLQTFAIPGSVFLSILSGFLYPFYLALFLVCMCSGIGATGCYMISYLIGKPIINKFLFERVQRWNAVVDGQREYLLNYLLFLRITPFLPNWFINVVSPFIHIPVSLFFIATFLGVAPLSFIAIQGGTTLYELTTAGDAFSWTGVIVVFILALLSMLPVILKKLIFKKKSE